MNVGSTLKQIRKNKGISQIKISKNIISQAAYSKFEAGLRDIDTQLYIKLVDRLNISLEEFEYIRNDFCYSEKKKIIKKFFSVNYNNIESLKSLKKEIEIFLDENFDPDIMEYKLMCDAFLELHQSKDITSLKVIVLPIWDRISKYDQWYLNDIRLINTILFIFPIDTALDFTNTVLKRLDKYKEFNDAEILKYAFTINLSLLLIKNREYDKALKIIDDSLSRSTQKMNYHILALHYSRKAICYYNLKYSGSEKLLKKSEQLTALYNDPNYWEVIQSEFCFYTKEH